jgi:hypothetical protein
MWIVALWCAAVGALLSTYFRVFALPPFSLFVIGLTATYGFFHDWSVLALTIMAIANIVVSHLAYGIAGYLLTDSPRHGRSGMSKPKPDQAEVSERGVRRSSEGHGHSRAYSSQRTADRSHC